MGRQDTWHGHTLEPPRLRARLLAWYRRNKRRLPWRAGTDPYRIWVSEVMLQQTTVRTVVPYYEAFLSRFPSVFALADASEEQVLASWSGLGYYHRARNLLRGARHVVAHHTGSFPKSLEAALAVPGVGLYTASAILSIAHGVALPVVDGNVRRVLSRLLALRGPRYRKDGPFYALAEELLDRAAPGDFNQALMELGATVCRKAAPRCAACPLTASCEARALGAPERFPEARARRAGLRVNVAAAIVRRDGRVLLARRPAGRLLGRMWELPQTGLDGTGIPDLEGELRERLGLEIARGPLLARARHAVTHRRLSLLGYEAALLREAPADPERFRWASAAELEQLPLSSMTRKLLASAASRQLPLALGE